MKKEQTPMETDEEIRVLKMGVCPSLSGRSDLTYEIGCNSDKAIFIRLKGNTGSGMFSKAWVPLTQIALSLSADDKPITSSTIRSLYTGSANSVGFLLAVLKDLGLIKNIDENSRGYTRTDPKKFTAEMHALIEKEAKPQVGKSKNTAAKKPEIQSVEVPCSPSHVH
jgi:hypothetical protein